MTVRKMIPIEDATKRFKNLISCTEEAPAGTYVDAIALREAIGGVADDLLVRLQRLGLKTDNCDGIFEIEVAIYNMVLERNPEARHLFAAEGFGEHVQGPAGDRVRANAIRDRDFLDTVSKSRIVREVAMATGRPIITASQSETSLEDLMGAPYLDKDDPLKDELFAFLGRPTFSMADATWDALKRVADHRGGEIDEALTDEFFGGLLTESEVTIRHLGVFIIRHLDIQPNMDSKNYREALQKYREYFR